MIYLALYIGEERNRKEEKEGPTFKKKKKKKKEKKKKTKKRKKKKKKKKKKKTNSTPNGKLGNTSFAPTTRMELRRPHPGIHVRSTPKRTTSSFYTPIKFRRENNPQKNKGLHGSKHGMKDPYRPSKHTINRRLGEVQHS